MDSIVHLKLPADDCEVATKTALPVLVAQHKYCFSPRLFVIRTECTAQQRFQPEYIEEIPGHHSSLNTLRLFSAKQHKRHFVVLHHRRERRIPISVVLDVLHRKI